MAGFPTCSRSYPVVAVLVCAALAALACGPAEAPVASSGTPPGSPAPEILGEPAVQDAPVVQGALQFEKVRHDFGRVFDIEELRCSFPFENKGGGTVVIQDVKAACGCTTPTLARDTFAAGESDVLEASWEPKGFGRQSKTITVRSDGLDGGVLILTITAEITPFVRSTPATLKFDDIEIAREHKRRVVLSCEDPDWRVQTVRSSHPQVHAAIVDGEDEARKVLEVTVGPEAAWGFLTSRIYVEMLGRVSEDTEIVAHTSELTVSATVVGAVRISQPMFMINKIAPGPFQAEVVLSREDGAPFKVVDLQVAPGAPPVGLTVRAERAMQNGAFVQRLILEGDAGGYLGYVRGSVSFSTDVPGEETRTLRYGGNVVAE